MPQIEDPQDAVASELAFRRSLRASRARRAAAAQAARRRLRGRSGAVVLCGALALGGGSALAAVGGASPDDAPAPTASTASAEVDVAAAQRALGVPADGIVGPVTRSAIRRFQRAHDLDVTGRLDRATLMALGLLASAAASPRSAAIPAATAAALARIAQCESGGNPRAVSADGRYRGKYQFSRATWRAVGGTGDPAKASEVEQDRRAAILYARTGPSSWPVCGA